MKKRWLLLVLGVLLLFLCSACAKEDTPGESADVPPSNSSSESPEYCTSEHDFSVDEDICSLCGLDYFSATLEFTCSDDGKYYILTGPGNCRRTKIVVPATYQGLPVKEIGNSAFEYKENDWVRKLCGMVESIELPYGIRKIGKAAFKGCSSLQQIVLPLEITKIEESTFEQCTSLVSVQIPSNVTSIGEKAFYNCISLEQVVFPHGLQEMRHYAFSNCKSLVTLDLPDAVTTFGRNAFSGCESLESVRLPTSVTSVSDSMFKLCTSLKTVIMEGNVQSIGSGAFSSCGLESVVLPESMESIGEYAFSGCANLRSINIPSGVKQMGEFIFRYCPALETTSYDGVNYIGNENNPYFVMLASRDESRTELRIHDDTKFALSVDVCGQGQEKNPIYKNLRYIYIGKCVTTIEFDLLCGLDDLQHIEVCPDNTVYLFRSMCLISQKSKTLLKAFANATIPDDDSVAIIGAYAFEDVMQVHTLIIPDNILIIKKCAFRNCKDLEYIVVGAKVTIIEDSIVAGCTKLNAIYYYGSAPNWESIVISGEQSDSAIVHNSVLLRTTVYYYSELPPTEEGNYWRYVDGVPTPWEAEE